MKTISFVTATLLATAVIGSASAQAMSYTVDCGQGQTISAALAQGDSRKPLVVNVLGVCNESVTITRDNVTLLGDPAVGATINAPSSNTDVVTVQGKGVTLENLVLTGGGLNGIRIEGAFRSVIRNCMIQGASADGIRVFVGDVRVMNSTIQGSGANGVTVNRGGSVAISGGSQINANANIGIHATGNAVVSMNGGTISDNGTNGVLLENGSQGSFNNSTISRNGTEGLLVLTGANAGIANNTISENGGDGVVGYLGTTLVLAGNVINGNTGSGVVGNAHATVQIGGATINNNMGDGIVLMLGSKLVLEGPSATQSNGNAGFGLWCGDDESSVNDLGVLSSDGNVDCTGY